MSEKEASLELANGAQVTLALDGFEFWGLIQNLDVELHWSNEPEADLVSVRFMLVRRQTDSLPVPDASRHESTLTRSGP